MVKSWRGKATWHASGPTRAGVPASVSRLSAPNALASKIAGADRFSNLEVRGSSDVLITFYLSYFSILLGFLDPPLSSVPDPAPTASPLLRYNYSGMECPVFATLQSLRRTYE
jgi:hypothetical protein